MAELVDAKIARHKEKGKTGTSRLKLNRPEEGSASWLNVKTAIGSPLKEGSIDDMVQGKTKSPFYCRFESYPTDKNRIDMKEEKTEVKPTVEELTEKFDTDLQKIFVKYPDILDPKNLYKKDEVVNVSGAFMNELIALLSNLDTFVQNTNLAMGGVIYNLGLMGLCKSTLSVLTLEQHSKKLQNKVKAKSK